MAEEVDMDFLDEIAATTAESNEQDAVVGRWKESEMVTQRKWVDLWRVVRVTTARAPLAADGPWPQKAGRRASTLLPGA